jgi:hypothetical protein
MTESSSREGGKPVDVNAVAAELLKRWATTFTQLTWKRRLALLEQIEAQLFDDFSDEVTCQQVSQKFTSQVLQRIPIEAVVSKEQASILLNSDDERNRQAARAWLVLHRASSDLADDGSSGQASNKRLATRYNVNLPGIIADDETFAMGQLIDISATGARVEVYSTPPASRQVFVEFPLIGRVMATAMWVASQFVGLSFATDPLKPKDATGDKVEPRR